MAVSVFTWGTTAGEAAGKASGEAKPEARGSPRPGPFSCPSARGSQALSNHSEPVVSVHFGKVLAFREKQDDLSGRGGEGREGRTQLQLKV